jgi:transcriptional regulator with XRE-family HTH domain
MFDMTTSGTSVDPLREEQEALEFQRQIGRNIRHWRIQRALTAEEFARRSGKPVATINEIELGEAMPSVEFLWRAAQVLMVSCLAFTDPQEHRSAA